MACQFLNVASQIQPGDAEKMRLLVERGAEAAKDLNVDERFLQKSVIEDARRYVILPQHQTAST